MGNTGHTVVDGVHPRLKLATNVHVTRQRRFWYVDLHIMRSYRLSCAYLCFAICIVALWSMSVQASCTALSSSFCTVISSANQRKCMQQELLYLVEVADGCCSKLVAA
jgi:hypothetical protein